MTFSLTERLNETEDLKLVAKKHSVCNHFITLLV